MGKRSTLLTTGHRSSRLQKACARCLASTPFHGVTVTVYKIAPRRRYEHLADRLKEAQA
jgi:hypothetical protein